MGIKGFIFDLDGVIADTAEFHFEAWQRLAQRYWNTVREAQIAAMAQAHQR